MSDKSFGDHTNRNVVKNPLLSTSVVGLSLQELSSNAVLLPVAQSPALVASQDRQGGQPAAPHHKQSGDSNQHTNTLHKPQHIPQAKPTDDFDVSEYFARLQGTRYVSAPINTNTELEKSALEQAEENLEEINLNDQPVQQSITSDIAQNFSQLPQVLPQVASAVFSSFSSMLSYKSREVTPEVDADAKMADGKMAEPGYREVQFASPPGLGGKGEESERKREVAPPPKDLVGSTQNTFRITTKKKSYAQIPGLSSGETVPMSQYSQHQTHASPPYYVPGFEPGQPNPPAQMTDQLPSFNLGQTSHPPTSFGAPGFQSGQIAQSGQIISQIQSFVPASSELGGFQSGQPQIPPTMTQTSLYNQEDRFNIAVTGQIEADFSTSVQENVGTKVPSVEFAVNTFGDQDGAHNKGPNLQSIGKANEPTIAKSASAFNLPQNAENVPKTVENILAFKSDNIVSINPSQSIQIFTPPQPNSSQDTAYDIPKNKPQSSSSFSNVPVFTGHQSTPIIPPPTMFSNQRRDSKTDVGKTILPPSVARRLTGNQPLIKQPANAPMFQANIFVPAPIDDPATQDSFTAVSDSSSLEQTSIPSGFSDPPISGANLLPQVPPPIGQNVAPPPNFFATSNVSSAMGQNVAAMAPPPIFLNPSLASEPAKSAPIPNIFTQPNAAVNLPSTSNFTTATTQMFDPKAFATIKPDQTVPQNIVEPPKPAFDPIAFTTNPPEPPKVVPDPPKISAGNTNFRLSKKRPQYYSGPIEGVGSISNNVKPTIPQAALPGAYQGALFAPESVKPPGVPTLDSNQPFIPSSVPLEATTVPFDLSKPAEPIMGSNYEYSISDQQQNNMIQSQINTAFDFSRQTAQNVEQPKQESKGFGLIGSLKSKLSALDINKIQNSVTTFFDPAYNEGAKMEADNYGQISQNYSQNTGQMGQNYGQTAISYGQPGQSGQSYGHQDQQTNLEIFIPSSQQMPEQAFNQQCYDSTYNQCQSSNMNVHGLQENNQYFPDHYNYYQHPTADQLSYYTAQKTTHSIQQSVENPPTTEQIQENNTANVYSSNVYNFNQMSEDVTSKDYFYNQHQTNVNQYGDEEVKHMTKQQVDAKVVTDKLLQNQTVGYQEFIPKPISDSDLSVFQLGENAPTTSQIGDMVPIETQATKRAITVDDNKYTEHDSTKPIAEGIPTKEEEIKPETTPAISRKDEAKANDSKLNLLGHSSHDNDSEVRQNFEDLTLEDSTQTNFGGNNASFFFDNIDQTKELSERTSEEDITDLKMCETCREVNSSDSSKTDLTEQLIQNITAPIQLSNPVEVPLTEIDTPLVENVHFVSNPCAEISHVTEETIEAIQLATELEKKDTEKFDQRPEIPEITNYGWCDSQTVALDRDYDLVDPNIQTINQIQNYAFHTDPSAIGFISNNSLFFDDIPTNASDEIKAEFKNAHEEPTVFTRQMSIPSAPAEEDLDNARFDSGGIDVQLIEQDAKRDFPVFEEFVIEPSETDDDKVKERERSSSEEEVNETDTFTNRLERFKKLEDSVEPTVTNLPFKVQTSISPSITIASYFDTGNYAAETHYRNSLTSPSSVNAMNLGAQSQNASVLPPAYRGDADVNKPLFPDVDKSIFKVPNVGTQTTIATTTATSDVSPYTTTTAYIPTFRLPERSFVPQPSTKETPRAVNEFANPTLPQEKVLEAEVTKETRNQPPEALQGINVAQTLPDPMNFFSSEQSNRKTDDAGTNRLASYFTSPAKTSDNTKSFFELSEGQDHLKDKSSKNWETTQSYKSFFEENVAEEIETDQNFTDTAARKEETLRQQRQSLGRDEQGSSNQHQNWESTQSFKSYFDTDEDATSDKASKNKTLCEMTQSQHMAYTPDQYRANLQLIKDLTSASNFQPTDDQVVRTVNYNSVVYPNRITKTDLSTGEPKPKNSDIKFLLSENLEDFYVKSSVEAAPVPDDSKLEILVNKCKLCCDLNSNRVVLIKDADFDNIKVRKAMDGNSTEGKQNGSASPEKQPDAVSNNKTPSPELMVKFEDNKEDANATLSDNRAATEYTPVRHHWFYRVDAEGKSIWRGFSVIDNKALEEAFTSPALNENTVVPTDGGRFDVNVVGRLRVAVYWADKPTNVRRCSWFYKGTTDARYVPYTEAVAEKLEEEYRHGISTGEWHRRLVLPNNEAVVMHGPAVMVHFLQSSAADAWSGGAQSTMRPRVVRRGYDESEIEDSEPSSIDHLLLLCHGVGSACDMRFRSVEEVVDDFRATSLQLIQGHYKSSYDDGVVGRVEVLPISWHSTLHSGEGGVDRRLARITLDSIPRLRSFTNDTVLDVLFYTSPVFCQTILDEVCKELNRIYTLFKQRNPEFEGGVSLGGHSLGSVILYDLLCHQTPKDPGTDTSNKAEKVVTGSAGTGQPTVTYPALHFTPQALYALGSPIAIFECIRGVDCLGEQFALPDCKKFFNIFHPYDPIAYRIEPLINPQLKNVSPFLIPHHKGRKRMHLELKETVARVGADIKQKLMESIKSTWSSMWRAPPPAPAELEKVLEEQLDQEALTDPEGEGEGGEALDVDATELLGQLNAGRRVDYVLQEAPFEMINEYLFAMSSHVCYWESEDTMLLMLREIYDEIGVQPDCCLPQQTMAVQRTRTLGKNEDILANAESASTSGVNLEKS